MTPTQMLYCDSNILLIRVSLARRYMMTVTKDKKQNTPSDSKTLVTSNRTRLTFRIDPKLKEALIKHVEANGLSLCHIYEALTTAYLYGVSQFSGGGAKSPTINLTLVRDVQRVRRYAVEGVKDVDAGSVLGEHASLCHYCLMEGRRVDAVGTYTYVKTMQVYGLCHFHSELMLDTKKWR